MFNLAELRARLRIHRLIRFSDMFKTSTYFAMRFTRLDRCIKRFLLICLGRLRFRSMLLLLYIATVLPFFCFSMHERWEYGI